MPESPSSINILEYYNKLYHTDDTQERPLAAYEYFLDLLEIRTGERILDISCGNGPLLKIAEERGLTAFGVDFSSTAVSKAFRRAPLAHLAIGDGEALPIKNESFAYITSLGVIEHYIHPELGVAEVARILTKEGRACIMLPNKNFFYYRLGLASGTGQIRELLLSFEEWEAMLDRNGLVIDHYYYDPGPDILKNLNPIGIVKRTVLKTANLLPRKFWYQYIFLCRKK